MKRICAFLLALIMCLSLCACGKSEAVKAVESLIADIGTVSVSSGDKIRVAEEAYAALSAEEQKKVNNFDVLEKAKDDFAQLGVHLTLDNYDKYLDVSVSRKLLDGIDFAYMMGLDKAIGTNVYSAIQTEIYVQGKSANYDYNDVVVTVKITGFYVPQSAEVIRKTNKGEISTEDYFLENMNPIDITLTAVTDIVGKGSDSAKITMEDSYWVWDSTIEIGYEVVSVSGILTK